MPRNGNLVSCHVQPIRHRRRHIASHDLCPFPKRASPENIFGCFIERNKLFLCRIIKNRTAQKNFIRLLKRNVFSFVIQIQHRRPINIPKLIFFQYRNSRKYFRVLLRIFLQIFRWVNPNPGNKKEIVFLHMVFQPRAIQSFLAHRISFRIRIGNKRDRRNKRNTLSTICKLKRFR